MNNFYVYVIHNIINNKIYVGESKTPQKRWLKHIRVSASKRNREKFYIHRAINKYGKDNFTFTVIQNFSNENDCLDAERYWISYFNSKNKLYGYNLTDGGEGVSGKVVSEETKQKIREKALGRKHSEETKELLRVINTGKTHSLLSKQKMSAIHAGKVLTLEHKNKISIARKGIVFTPEHCQNMSKSLKGLFVGEKNPFYGKQHSLETKELCRGENNKSSKLKEYQVIEIRKKYEEGNYTRQQLANEYNVSRRSITHIINKTTWGHIK